jgi:2-oxoglutarate dehydrogenase E1 component
METWRGRCTGAGKRNGKEILGDLQERLDEVKQNPLPYKYQPPELGMEKIKKGNN